MKYRPEIDGLRSVAVVPVILFHGDIGLLSGGYVGVDVFFVISGYLITTLLIRDFAQGHFSLMRFYERRARRILPALFFVMLACLPPSLILMMPEQSLGFFHSLMAVVGFVSNLLFWKEDGYFGASSELKPLLHTWSLAVEEQFYLVFPPMLWGLWRLGSKRMFWVLLGVALVSLALSEWGWRFKPTANFYLAPTRVWELLAGALAAFWLSTAPRGGSRASNILATLSLCGIVIPVFVYDNTIPFPSLYALAPVLGATGVILFAGSDTWVGRLLGSRLPVGIGLISYSAYLWHQPLFAFARLSQAEAPSSALMLSLAATSLLLAILSWRFVEQPFRRKDSPWLTTRSSLFLGCASVGALIFAIGLSGHLASDQITALWLAKNPEIAQSYRLLAAARQSEDFGRDREGRRDLGACRFDIIELDTATMTRLQDCQQRFGPGVLILGDSHAIDLYGAVASRFDDIFLVGLTRPACRAGEDRPECAFSALLDLVTRNPGLFRKVIYEQAGFYLMKAPDGTPGRREMFADLALSRQVPAPDLNETGIDRTVDYLVQLGRRVPVTWFGPRMEPHLPDQLLLRLDCGTEVRLRPGQEEAFQRLDKDLAARIRDKGGITYASQIDILGFDPSEDIRTCDAYTFVDGDHYSAAGETRFGARLPPDFLAP